MNLGKKLAEGFAVDTESIVGIEYTDVQTGPIEIVTASAAPEAQVETPAEPAAV